MIRVRKAAKFQSFMYYVRINKKEWTVLCENKRRVCVKTNVACNGCCWGLQCKSHKISGMIFWFGQSVDELLFRLHSTHRLSNNFWFRWLRSFRSFGCRDFGTRSIIPPPFFVFLSIRNVSKCSDFISQSFTWSWSLSHVSVKPYTVFLPRSFKSVSIWVRFWVRLWQLIFT